VTETVSVALGDRSYDVKIGSGLLAQAGHLIAPLLRRKRVAIVTDLTVAMLPHLEALRASLEAASIEYNTVVLPAGEATKSFAELERLCDALLELEVERGDLVIALGGGVIGDIAGLASGLLKRGIDFVQIPTTLLAQVDSSVGGKTAINAKAGKNLVGLFNQPRLVIADTNLLDTLPKRELLAGYAEVVKYGLIGDRPFFEWLEVNGQKLLDGDKDARVRAVQVSCAAKARIVEADERETNLRALLNLGHTFGHALEAATGYGDRLIHGEGVSIGMALAFELSARLGLATRQDSERVTRHLKSVGLPTTIREIKGLPLDTATIISHMTHDKKAKGGKLTFILARGIGDAFVTSDVAMEKVRDVLTA
jgi:3-dehydroquinate synthase